MVKSLISLILLLFFQPVWAAEPLVLPPMPMLDIQPSVLVLGDIQEGDEAIATFLVRNNSAQAITLVDIQASCGCTSAEPTSYIIPAYGFTQLKVQVDTTAKQQHIKKTVSITDSLGHQATASLTFSVLANPHRASSVKPKGIFDGQCAACHYEPVRHQTSGKAIYDAACVMCHGLDGQGAYAPKLSGYASMDALQHIIRHGVGKPQMPAFAQSLGGPLNENQINTLSQWLMGLPE